MTQSFNVPYVAGRSSRYDHQAVVLDEVGEVLVVERRQRQLTYKAAGCDTSCSEVRPRNNADATSVSRTTKLTKRLLAGFGTGRRGSL